LALIIFGAGLTLFLLQHKLGGRDGSSDIRSLAGRDDINVLFILIDTLRSDRLGSYGYHRDTSPTLDRLASQGIRFDRHFSQSSWTKCSMASLWTGLYPARTGVLRYSHVLSDDALLPAEIFREAGYRTVAIWRNGWVAPNFGFSQGFEFYTSPRPSPLPPGARQQNPAIKLVGSDADVVFSAVEYLRTVDREENWFLYLHLMDVHQYVSDIESARFGTTYSDIYDNSIHWVDRHLGMLVDELVALGLRDRTLILIASDHGEAFGEHHLEGHARNLYREVTQTPWILSLPFRLEPGIVVTTSTQNVDIWPTVLDLLGLPGLPDADGRSSLEAIEAAAANRSLSAEPRIGFAQLDRTWGRTERPARPIVSARIGGLHAIVDTGAQPALELYDQARDPEEQINLAMERPEDGERLQGEIEAYLRDASPPWSSGVPEVELDDMMLNQLRALGYKVD
jgi:arylsulfatase A-like enzyme